MRKILLLLPLAVILSGCIAAAKSGSSEESTNEPPKEETVMVPTATNQPVRITNTVTIAGERVTYVAETGMLPVLKKDGGTTAFVFYVAYTRSDEPDKAKRPVTFCFNGGPGSSSVWLHMGALGPRRVRLQSNGDMPRPPFELEDNQETWNRWDKTLQNSHSEGKYPTRELQNGRFQKDTRGRRLEWSAQKPRRPLQSFLSGFPR